MNVSEWISERLSGLVRRYRDLYMDYHRLRIELALNVSACIIAEALAVMTDGVGGGKGLERLAQTPSLLLYWVKRAADPKPLPALHEENGKISQQAVNLERVLNEFEKELAYTRKVVLRMMMPFLHPVGFRRLVKTLAAWLVIGLPISWQLILFVEKGWGTWQAQMLSRCVVGFTGILLAMLAIHAFLPLAVRYLEKLKRDLRKRPCYRHVERINAALDSLAPGP